MTKKTTDEKIDELARMVAEGFRDVKDDIKFFRNETNQRFEKVDERFERVDERFDKIDENFREINMKLHDRDENVHKNTARIEKLEEHAGFLQ